MAIQTIKENIFNVIANNSDEDEQGSVTSQVDNEKGSETKDSETKDSETKVSNIIPFQGCSAVPLLQSEDDGYPPLGAFSKTKSSKATSSKATSSNGNSFKKNDVIRFVVGTSYKDVQNRRRYRKNHQSDEPRSRAFAKLEDKEAIAKSFVGTRACNNVTRKNENDKYGVCYRTECMFAHSLSELKDPMCSFDESCRFRWGKPTQDGSRDPSNRCQFRHSSESIYEWLERTGRKLPDLPLTSEKTRKPRKIEQKIDTKTPEKPIDSQSESAPPNTPRKARKSQWDLKPLMDSLPVNSLPVNSLQVDSTPVKSIARKLKTSSSESENDRQSRRRYRRRSRSCSPRRSRSRSLVKESQIIRVPNKDLAEFAIKAAFDRGIYNIQVVVE